MRKRHKNKVNKNTELMQSAVGVLIDMPLEDFKTQVVNQKINVGTLNGLCVYFSSLYAELKGRKDAVMNLVFEKGYSKDDPDIKNTLNGLYAEMVKIEDKVVFMKQRVKELIDLGVD